MKRAIMLVLALTMIMSFFAGCGSSSSSSSSTASSSTAAAPAAAPAAADASTEIATIKSSKDTMVVGTPQDPTNFDPNDNPIQMVWTFKKNLYETLVSMDDEGNIIPMLAESWEYNDEGTVITFHIRKGVKFHNGDELKAEDVLFSYQRAKDIANASVCFTMVDWDNTKVIDDYTFQLANTQVYVPQLNYLAWPLASIFCKAAYEAADGDFFEAAMIGCGTGAYKPVDFIAGDTYTLVAHDEYWQEGKPYIKNVIFRVIGEATNRTIELETSGVDLIYEAPSADIARLEGESGIVVYRDPSMNTNFILFRCDHEPFDNVLLRKAVAYAVDIPTAIATAYKGTGVPATGWCSPGVKGYADIGVYTQDQAKAKELLAEAGCPDGFEFTISVDTTQERMDLAEVFQAQLAEVGIICDIKTYEPVAYQAMYAQGEHDLMLYGLTITTGEGDKAFRWWTTSSAPGQMFDAWHTDEYDALIDDAAATLDEAARMDMYKQAQETLRDECVVVPTLHREILTAATEELQGFKNDIWYESPMLKDCYFG